MLGQGWMSVVAWVVLWVMVVVPKSHTTTAAALCIVMKPIASTVFRQSPEFVFLPTYRGTPSTWPDLTEKLEAGYRIAPSFPGLSEPGDALRHQMYGPAF